MDSFLPFSSSFLSYLSPSFHLPSSLPPSPPSFLPSFLPPFFLPSLQARIRYSPDALLQTLAENSKFDWVRRRISTSWPEWERAGRLLAAKKPFQHTEKRVSDLYQLSVCNRTFMFLFCSIVLTVIRQVSGSDPLIRQECLHQLVFSNVLRTHKTTKLQ